MIICPNLKNPDVAREFNELVQATSEQAAYHIWSLNNGNAIDKAPNGASSKLFQSLLDYYGGDRVKAIRAKARAYSKSFLSMMALMLRCILYPGSELFVTTGGKFNLVY